MEIQLRIILLVIGVLILIGVAIDLFRRKPNEPQRRVSSPAELKPQAHFIHEEQPTHAEAHIEPELDLDLDLSPAINSYDYVPDVADYATVSEPVELETETKPIEDIIAIFIMSRAPRGFDGDELYSAISNAHFHLAANNIFYRFEHEDGTGEQLFSLVKAVEPGYFEPYTLRTERVPGITLLMLPGKLSNPLFALDKLIRAAKQIAFVLNGELLDQNREALTLTTIDKYKLQIQEKANAHEFSTL